MKIIGGILAVGAALVASAALYGCAAYPTMSISPAAGQATQPTAEESSVGPGRGGNTLRAADARPQTIPGIGPSRTPAVPATAAQIAALVPEGPINATLTSQPVAQYLNTLFNDVLHIPLALGPTLGQRTDIITINAAPSTPKRAYVTMLQQALRAYGMTLSVTADGFMVTEDGATPTGGRTTPIIRSRTSADTPAGNGNVVQFFQLVALRADAVLAAFGGSGDNKTILQVPATSDPAANAIVLQGPGRSVAAAVEFLRNLDQPAFAGSQVVRLEPVFWAPDAFAQALAQVLQAEGYIVAADPLGEKSIMILPMTSTNQTFVFAADAATMTRVQYWARELDQPSAVGDQSTTYVYEVRNTSATTIGQMLINAGAQAGRAGIVPGGGFNGVAGAAAGFPGGAPQQAGRGGGAAAGGGGANAAAGRGGANANAGRGGANAAAGRGGANAGRGGNNANFAAARGGTNVAGAVPTGGVITVDDASNRILFTGSPSQYAQLRGLIRELNSPARQVLVEVTVAEVTLTDETSYGVEWFFNHANGSSGGIDLSGGTMLRTPGAVTTTTTGTGANQVTTTTTAADTFSNGLNLGNKGLNLSWMNGPNLRAQFNAFASNDKVNILSRPQIMARSGTASEIQVGVDAPIIIGQRAANTGTTDGTADVTQQIQYRQTGIILQITPTVYGDDRVDIQVYQEVSSVRDNTNPAIQSPFIDNRNITTTLSLSDGQTAVLGGSMQDSFGKANGGIPFLKDIPILGAVFRTDQVHGAKTELMMLITPIILHNEDDMAKLTDQMIGEVNNAFTVSRGGSYTLTPFASGRSIGLNPPNPVINGASLSRPGVTPVPGPAVPGAGRGP